MEGNDLPVLRNVEIALVIGAAFCQIALPAAAYGGLVLRMPQHQIGNVKLLGQYSGILYRTVVLLIGLVQLPLFIETEGFMKQPVASLHIGSAERIVRLVPGAG